LRELAEKDHIDRMLRSVVNAWNRMTGGRIYHCRYCRVQFHDKRTLAEQATLKRMTV